jgi:hypothetical protein
MSAATGDNGSPWLVLFRFIRENHSLLAIAFGGGTRFANMRVNLAVVLFSLGLTLFILSIAESPVTHTCESERHKRQRYAGQRYYTEDPIDVLVTVQRYAGQIYYTEHYDGSFEFQRWSNSSIYGGLQPGSTGCSQFPFAVNASVRNVTGLTNMTDPLSGFGSCGTFGKYRIITDNKTGFTTETFVSSEEGAPTSECCCCSTSSCRSQLNGLAETNGYSYPIQNRDLSRLGYPMAYEPVHQVCVPFGVHCPDNENSSFNQLDDCSCTSGAISWFLAAGNGVDPFLSSTMGIMVVFPLELLGTLALVAARKSENNCAILLPCYACFYAFFYAGAALMFYVGVWQAVSLLPIFLMVETAFLLFTLEMIQLLLLFVCEPKCRKDGYELFKRGFSFCELFHFLGTAIAALIIAMILEFFANPAIGHHIPMHVVSGIAGLIMVAALYDGCKVNGCMYDGLALKDGAEDECNGTAGAAAARVKKRMVI